MNRFVLAAVAVILPLSLFAEEDRSQMRKGNGLFEDGKFEEAELAYRRSMAEDSTSLGTRYNLANSLYRQGKTEAAVSLLSPMADTVFNESRSEDFYHNLANFLLEQKDYQGAVEAYRNSLRKRPDDMETKTNLAYAQEMLKNQQNQQDQQNQDNGDRNKDQNKDKDDKNKDQNQDQNQNQNKDQDRNNDQNDKDNDRSDDQGDGSSGQDGRPEISPETAQQLLNAMAQKENQTQEKVKKAKAERMKLKKKEKNW